jgi:diguanylate cyclase (GGDEF)-like protein/PAS domain S-box-containing protein
MSFMQNIVDKYIPISISDLQGDIIDANKAFCFLTKYSKEELIGKAHSILRYKKTPKIIYEDMWKKLLNDEVYIGELTNIAKDSSKVFVNVKIHPRYNIEGTKVGYIAIMEDITDRKLLEEKISIDDLTGLYNKLAFDSFIQEKCKYVKRYNQDLSLLIFDIDYFKKVNDSYGHLAGDNVLKIIAKILKERVRETDIVARWGGEEFVIILINANKSKSYKVAKSIKNSISSYDFDLIGKNITVSCGIAQFNNHKDCISLFIEADKALYEAKHRGRNAIVYAL